MFEMMKNGFKGTVGQTALGAIIGLAAYDGGKWLYGKFTREATPAPRHHKKVKKHTAPAPATATV